MLNRLVTFIGWVLSSLSLVIALAGLATPGAGKLMSLSMLGWCLIFFPPLWMKTIQYGLFTNIITRVVAFVILPVSFITIATANGYRPETSIEITQPTENRTSISPQPAKTESAKPSPTTQPIENRAGTSPQLVKTESAKPSPITQPIENRASISPQTVKIESAKPSPKNINPKPKTKSLSQWMAEDGNSLNNQNMVIDIRNTKILCVKSEGEFLGVVSAIDGVDYLMLYKANGNKHIRTIKAATYFRDRPVCDTTDGWSN